MINWTPEGRLGQLFKVLSYYAPASPPGAQPPPLWGNEQHLLSSPPITCPICLLEWFTCHPIFPPHPGEIGAQRPDTQLDVNKPAAGA